MLSEKLILGLLLAKSGVDQGKIFVLFAKEAKFGILGRQETLLLMSVSPYIARKTASRSFDELKMAWQKLASEADIPKTNSNPNFAGAFNEAKEMRFAMVATLAQLAYTAKLYLDAEKDNDNKTLQGELMAASFALSAGLADLGATGIKALHSLKDAAFGFQILKLGGGLSSVASAWIIYQQDQESADKSEAVGLITASRLYRLKSYTGLTSGAFSALTAISYTKPAFEMIASKFPNTLIGKSMSIVPRIGGSIVGRLLTARALLMLGGIWFSVGTIAIQILIWKFSDDKLQNWCARCAFGIDKENRIKDPKSQTIEFEESLLEIL